MKTKIPLLLLFACSIASVLFISFIPDLPPDQVPGLMMKKENFDTIISGKKVRLYNLQNKNGITVQVTNYGGHIVSIIAPDRDGNYADVVLGHNSISEYVKHKMYQACIIGPHAYVISGGKFSIDGVNYQLLLNNGKNNLHSFPDGFDKEVFSGKQKKNKVTLKGKIPDMKTGFPGNKDVTITYELMPDNTLRLAIKMTSDKKTLANITTHAYFNLAGEGIGEITGHTIQIFGDSITPYGPGSIPTGGIIPVENTPFDLREPTVIGKDINSDHPQIKGGRGYDRNFVLRKKPGEYGIDAILIDPVSGRKMEVHSNQPGLHFYSGGYLNGSVKGKSDKPYIRQGGLCLEPMMYPDSPNQPKFPSVILSPGEEYYNVMDFKFGVVK